MKTFHLKWSSHPSNMETVFATLLDSEGLSDVTLICGSGEAPNSKKNEQHHLRAHRLLLSTCSNFFLVCPDAPFPFFPSCYPISNSRFRIPGCSIIIISVLLFQRLFLDVDSKLCAVSLPDVRRGTMKDLVDLKDSCFT